MKRKLLAIFSILTASMFIFAGIAKAQDEEAVATATEAVESTDAPAADAAPEKPKVAEKTMADYWRAGGITMYPLGLLAIFGTTLVVYNFITIRKKKFLNPEYIKQLEIMANELKVREAIQFCEKNPSPLTNIVGVGLARADERELDVDSITAAMEEASTEEFSTPFVFINYLALIASLSPMLGLYGTVSGMVKAFNTIAAEGAGSASKLADNISEALITTAAGMIIGMPAMFFFFFFKNKFGAIISGASRIIGDLIFTLKMSSKYGPQDVSEMVQDEQEAVKEG